MFVRTKKGKIFDCVVHEQMGKPIYYPKTSETNGYIDWNEVYKKSENIIDILEVGDYVNGVLIEEIFIKDEDRLFIHSFESEIMLTLTNDNVKSIATREQMESISYRIGG